MGASSDDADANADTDANVDADADAVTPSSNTRNNTSEHTIVPRKVISFTITRADILIMLP